MPNGQGDFATAITTNVTGYNPTREIYKNRRIFMYKYIILELFKLASLNNKENIKLAILIVFLSIIEAVSKFSEDQLIWHLEGDSLLSSLTYLFPSL